jgi:hypothetical protein
VYEAVPAGRWKQAADRSSRIELPLGAIVLLLLADEAAWCRWHQRWAPSSCSE